MAQPHPEQSQMLLDILESVSRDGQQSQRRRASEFGVALGLVNSYLKYCIRKGFVKVKRIPAQRYVYYLTPKGFTEKSRLTVVYLSNSLAFFRQARADCTAVFAEAQKLGWRRVALAGASELAEISALCALETKVEIVAVIDAKIEKKRFVDLPVVGSLSDIKGQFDGVVVTDRFAPQATFDAVTDEVGGGRVLAPSLLGVAQRLQAAMA